MISYKHRFHGRNSLRFVYANGKTYRSATLALRVAENQRVSQYRCAVVVSKKVSKSAVKRNRIRRRIYEIIRKNETKITPHHDIVATVYSDQVAVMPATELEETVLKLIHQATNSTS